ncbi:hypothetical protein DV711_02205 [Motiliproteus coralliicola]|uniref:Periplasmic binding protein domain-containing protein n=1 Tax=Motiliproteus coralliicola TaxID=2283196 RepID=A0A369WS92_9GAMM|nr:ABC transporter substrate-binding protein [Motiliproteus coralliicola]RDE24421.1 hypothetical protein DV711_02205 [Motiliproteus coralliicola]
MYLYRRWLLLLVLLSLPAQGLAAPSRVALFLPHSPTAFWQQLVRVMADAGDDFGMELEVHYGEDDHQRYVRQIQLRLQQPSKPDFMVFKPYKKTTRAILDLAEAARVPTITFNTLPFDSERLLLGQPRERYRYWLAEFAPDDEEGGYDLARYLIQVAKQRQPSGVEQQITVLGINGPVAEMPARLRYEGLKRAVEEDPLVELLQVVNVDWRRSEAHRVVGKLLRRHQQISVIWTAADVLALGGADLLAERGAGPAFPVIGGFDWVPEVRSHIRAGRVQASVGGHFFEGAWVMVVIHDYLMSGELDDLDVRYLSGMGLLVPENIDQFSALFNDEDLGVDFRRFSRVMNPLLMQYDFSISTLVESP